MTKFVFVNESENIFERFVDENISINKSSKEKLKFINNKLYNNYIGCFQFRNEDNLIKLIILPKIIDRNKFPNSVLLEYFFKYFNYFYNLKNKYSIPVENIDGNILDFSFKHSKDNINLLDMNSYINYKYVDAINTLLKFFKKHSNVLSHRTEYISQGIKHHLDVRKNILEINKSKIHQYKKNSINKSEYADIGYKVITNFISFILPNLEDIELLKTKSFTLCNLLNKKFKINNSFNMSLLLNNRIKKMFIKSNELHEVYNAMIILSGYEKYSTNEVSLNSETIYQINDLVAVFFRPEVLFEWIVYDKLPELFGADYSNIKKDRKDTGTSSFYHIIKNGSIEIKKLSNPDFLIFKDTKTIIVDAKWKILYNNNPNDEDIFKLERDNDVRDNIINNFLIYPLPIDATDDKIEDTYKVDYSSFKFKTIQIKII
ncbi:5-methylcytosine restriction system specificity protein McrC [Aliarcobacter lanthieri]|uniref:5-methylcytosine restriction system specificity protein McrC n=1 Tax=Aliarcobacter lanthieri TaxID=1355374 RepID=UPI003AAD5BD7